MVSSRSWVLAALIAAPALAGCLVDDGFAHSVEAPQWHSGYAFSFTTSGTVRVMASEDGDTERMTEDIEPRRRVAEVLNTTFQADGEPVFVVAIDALRTVPVTEVDFDDFEVTQQEVPVVGLAAHRQADLAHVPMAYSVTSQCTDGACSARVNGLSFGREPPFTLLDFPLTHGKSWSYTVPASEVGSFEGTLEPGMDVQVRAKVVGRETVDLPVGATESIRIDFSYRPADLEEWREEVMEEAEDEDVRLDVLDYSAYVNQRLYYSESYQNVVRGETTSEVNLRIAGTDDGEEFQYSLSAARYVLDELDGARLVPRPERDFNYMGQLLQGAIRIADPRGASYEPVGYTLDLDASASTVNAATPEPVQFTTRVLGAPDLPEGHTVSWRITDTLAETVAAGEGFVFDYAFDQPGRYAVEVEAHDADGRTTAAAGQTVVANYDALVDAGCFLVSVQFFITCGSTTVPVRLGIEALTVEALRAAPVPVANFGQLELTDPLGTSQVAFGGPGQDVMIAIDDFEEFAVNGDDWTLEWQPQFSAVEQVQYHIVLYYGGERPADLAVPDEGSTEPEEPSPTEEPAWAPVESPVGSLLSSAPDPVRRILDAGTPPAPVGAVAGHA